MKAGADDGFGQIRDSTPILLADGKNPVELRESGPRERARALVERRALADCSTLGSAATGTDDMVDFGRDLSKTNLEMQKNPVPLNRRFGIYVSGDGEAAYDGVTNLAMI